MGIGHLLVTIENHGDLNTMTTPLNIQVILGSTRQGRFGDKPAHYLLGELQKRADVRAELVDLRDWPLPFFDHPVSPMRAKITEPAIVAKWAAKVGEADGYVIVTPEYNHGYSAVLNPVRGLPRRDEGDSAGSARALQATARGDVW